MFDLLRKSSTESHNNGLQNLILASLIYFLVFTFFMVHGSLPQTSILSKWYYAVLIVRQLSFSFENIVWFSLSLYFNFILYIKFFSSPEFELSSKLF
jgi:hypothetical protein